jgi:hypothetical protein
VVAGVVEDNDSAFGDCAIVGALQRARLNVQQLRALLSRTLTTGRVIRSSSSLTSA